jgi:3-phytase
VAAIESDGSEVTSVPLGGRFPHGLFVAMSNGRIFHYYSWDDFAAAAGLK